MQHFTHLFLATLVLGLVHTATAAESTAKAGQLAGQTAAFTAELTFGADGPVLPVRGTATLAGDRLRVSVTQDLTLEEYIVLVDYAKDSLTLLYPDTLNGKRYKLSAFDRHNGFARIRESLAGQAPSVPKGWQQSSRGQEKVDGVSCTHHRAVKPDKDQPITIDWWIGDGGVPAQARLATGDLTVNVRLAEWDRQASVDPALFQISADYTITDAGSQVPDGLPSL